MGKGGGGGGNTTTTQKADPWSGVQPFLIGGGGGYDPMTGKITPGASGIFPESQRLYQNQGWSADQQLLADRQRQDISSRTPGQVSQYGELGKSLMSGQFDPTIQRVGNISGAQEITSPQASVNNSMFHAAGPAATGSATGATAGQGQFNLTNLGLGNAPSNAYSRMLTGRADTRTLDPVVNSAMRRMTDNFNEQVIPGIGQGAMAAGQYGSSRHGIAQGLAAKGLSQSMGDMTGNMYNNAYNNAQAMMGNAAGQLGGFSTNIANNNAGLQTQASIASSNNSTQASLANAAAQNAMGQFNSAQANNMGQFNAGQANNIGLANADSSMRAQLANASNSLNAQQINANLGIQNNAQSSALAQQLLSNRMQGLNVGQSANQLSDQAYSQQQGLLDSGNQYNWNNLNRYASIVQPGSGIGGSSTTTSPSHSNTGAGMLGGALAGAQLGGLLGVGSGWGAGLGALAMLSDRRTKTDIEAVGRLDNGLTVYRYRYKAGGPLMLGVMADEVKAVNPGAVVNVGGVDYVNYGGI